MGGFQPQFSHSQARRSSFGKYVLAAILGALIVYVAMSIFIFTPTATLALPETSAVSSDGVLAIQANLSSEVYGLYLIDLRNQTILLYGYGGPWPRGLRLLSARSFQYDRKLLDFNTGKPSPREVQQLIEAGSTTLDLPSEPDKGPMPPASGEPK